MEQEQRNSKYLTGDWDTSEQGEHMNQQEYIHAPPTPREHLVSLPALELTQALYQAVVRSEDDDESATEALRKLQHRVLMACARFESQTVAV
jgi:hypothetical protein